jgi:hypothetical protein
VLNLYRSLGQGEKALVALAAIAGIAWIVAAGNANDGIVAAAQVAAALGTFVLAGLAYAQVREMRQARRETMRPQVLVEADQTKPPHVYVVVRNIGQGTAKNITFEFSDVIEVPGARSNPYVVPVNEQVYFKDGIPFLAPGAEISTLWGSMIDLGDHLRERGLHEGVTITSRYQALDGEPHVNEWRLNPLLMSNRLTAREPGMRQLVEAVQQLTADFNSVVSHSNNEIQVSSTTEREHRRRQSDGERS